MPLSKQMGLIVIEDEDEGEFALKLESTVGAQFYGKNTYIIENCLVSQC